MVHDCSRDQRDIPFCFGIIWKTPGKQRGGIGSVKSIIMGEKKIQEHIVLKPEQKISTKICCRRGGRAVKSEIKRSDWTVFCSSAAVA